MADLMSSPTGPHRYARLKALEHEELAQAIRENDKRLHRNQRQRERRRCKAKSA